MSDTFLLGNHLEHVKSTNEFYYSEVFLHPFTTVKAFYQRQIPSVTTANFESPLKSIVVDKCRVEINRQVSEIDKSRSWNFMWLSISSEVGVRVLFLSDKKRIRRNSQCLLANRPFHRGREGYRREREKLKKARFRYLLLLTSSQRNELNNVSWLPFNFLRGLKQNFIRERSQNTKIRSRGKNTALLPVKLETFPSRLHHRTSMRWHGTCTHPGVVNW